MFSLSHFVHQISPVKEEEEDEGKKLSGETTVSPLYTILA